MSAKDKDSGKTLEKLKQFFRINKGGTGNFKGRVDFSLTADIERDLGPETPLNLRTKTIKDLSEAVLNNRLEDKSIEKLWQCLKDLFHRDVGKETRHLVFSFFRCLVQGQYEKLGLMRVHFFRLIKSEEYPEDVAPRLDLLVSLTENGKDILYFEEEVGPFLLQWMPAVNSAGKNHEFLSMLVNVIKYNAALIDECVIKGLVENTCFLCCYSRNAQVVLTSLLVLDTVVCYSNLPSESLPEFVSALCRTVNNSTYCQDSWKIMRNLLGTHMGHSALYTMCRMLQDPASLQDKNLVRGAVFYINMGLWGNSKVPTLKYTPTSVLPSLLHALECNQPEVMYEVMLSIQRLVNKYGLELYDPSWDLVLSILEYIIKHIEGSGEKPSSLVSTHLHETICTIEKLIELGQFNGSVRRVFELIERLSPVRPEGSVLRLVSYVAAQITPTRSFWISRLNDLMERYFRQEKRTNIRIKVVDILTNVIQVNRAIYEDDLIERIIVPHFQHIDTDTDIVVRNAAARLLVDLCKECESKRCLELLDILQKLVNRPFDLHSADGWVPASEADVVDVKTAVIGLISIFCMKLYRLPSSHCINSYKLLVSFLDLHYHKPQVLDHCSNIRYMILDCFLKIRANSLCHLGFPSPSGLQFSPYIAVDHKEVERAGNVSPPPMSPAPTSYPHPTVTYLSMSHACKAVIMCLKHERDWKVLHMVLTELPGVLKNKALILCRHGNDVNLLADVLSTSSNDKTFMENLRNTPPKFARADYQNYVFPVLAALASYHSHLEPSQQQRLIKAMEVGLTRQCARQCITCLTLCILEMRDVMFKMLPEVILGLSKMSAAVYIAIPILEFLATLPRLPKVFASFVADQYMSVFAISLPYTNPFKYNHYTVSLAHHVIAVWFLKCRLPFRKDFVKFITTGLKANVLVPFEEGKVKLEMVNEDSSNRKRASSLTEQGSRRVRPLTSRTAVLDPRPQMDGDLMVFHQELTETCIDLMARYTFNTCSALPKRHPTAEFLLNNGQSMTWLLGHKLITVTTSGCSQKALKNGLCDKCWTLCRIDRAETQPQSPNADADTLASRHRARARVQRTLSSEVPKDSTNIATSEETSVHQSLTKQLSIDVNPRGVPPTGLASSATTSPVEESQKTLSQSEQPEVRSRLEQLLAGSKESERTHCACWCQGWAEIYVRRPTGDMSWVIRIQNPSNFQSSPLDMPLVDISTLFLPSLSSRKTEEVAPRGRPVLPTDLAEVEFVESQVDQTVTEVDCCQQMSPLGGSTPIPIPSSCDSLEEEPESIDLEGKSRNPVRRSNSSPEMSANWKNPFLKEKKETESGKQHKDPRVSCEAIPEEFSQSGSSLTYETFPALMSVHSDPGNEDPQASIPRTSSLVSPVSGIRSAFTPVSPSGTSIGQSPSVVQSPSLLSSTAQAPLLMPCTDQSPSVLPTSGIQSSSVKSSTIESPSVLSSVVQSPSVLSSAAQSPMIPSAAQSPSVISNTVQSPSLVSSAVQSPSVISSVVQSPSLSAVQSPSALSSAVQSPSVLSSAVQSPSLLSSAAQSPSVLSSAAQSPSAISSAVQSPQLMTNAVQSPPVASNTLQAAVVTSRPPQSPKLQQKVSSSSPSSPLTIDTGGKKTAADKAPLTPLGRDDSARLDPSALSPLAFRDRGHTISVMSPIRKPRIDWSRRDNSSRVNKEGPKSGINPSFVFLQLYHNAHFNSSDEKPLLLSQDDVIQRSIKILDHIPPYETHKIGVLYVGPGQASNEAEILRNQFGSLRYAEFLHRLGTLIRLKDADPQNTFLGGLHKDGNDGKFAYIWQDDVMQVTFHVATLMPTKDSDPHCNDKKLHIGNNYVTIVYNESGEEYNIQTVKGQFNYACVIIQPLDHSTNEVAVKTREELAEHITHSESKIVSDQNLAILARQLALHANLASMVSCSLKAHGQDPYASNWLERLRKIKRLKEKVEASVTSGDGPPKDLASPKNTKSMRMDDFTEYT